MLLDDARILADKLRSSEEYRTYCEAKERAYASKATAALLDEFYALRMKAQAASVAGTPDAETTEKLQRLGELLQFDAAAADYLMAEFRLNALLGEIYKILAKAVGLDLGAFEA
ncbi:MAG: YlbF family regulator [Clostridia bacterium]|nr:YlbF family regulator [Clostridia bacterium]